MKKHSDTNFFQASESYLETKRLELLSAFYEMDYSLAYTLYCQIFDYVRKKETLDENDLKRLNQIQTSCKKLKFDPAADEFSDLEELYNRLGQLITENVKTEVHNIQYTSFAQWGKKTSLSEPQKKLVFKTAMTFQLTTGCSNFCRRCNEWALPGVRKHFSYSAVKEILFNMAEQDNHEISLFGASDPLDWQHTDKTIFDIVEQVKQTPIECSLLTKVPKGKSSLLKKLINQQSNLSVSVTAKNLKRIQRIQEGISQPLSKQHETDDLLIPAGLDEDFISVKPSITDGYGTEITPDGAFIIIPAFTSALYPFGHKKIRVTSDTSFFPVKKTGRHALLVDYFKPLSGYALDQTPCYLDNLLDAQVESIILDTGEDELTPPGMRSIKEYLSIFEEKARLQRKKMTLSVMRRLKKQFLAHSRFKNLVPAKRDLYLKKIKNHLDLCKKKECKQAKIHTISFFLNSILAYQENNPLKIKILKKLLNNELDKNIFSQTDILKKVDITFSNHKTNSFNIFRSLVQGLVGLPDFTPENKNLIYQAARKFIQENPAIYDPVADLFVPA